MQYSVQKHKNLKSLEKKKKIVLLNFQDSSIENISNKSYVNDDWHKYNFN